MTSDKLDVFYVVQADSGRIIDPRVLRLGQANALGDRHYRRTGEHCEIQRWSFDGDSSRYVRKMPGTRQRSGYAVAR